MHDSTDILKSLPTRKQRWGIRAASDYANSFVGCLGDGFCPASLLGVPAEQWQTFLKDAESSLTYANERMIVKALSESDVPEGAIMTFDGILTATRKDRDGDVLEAPGALVDQKHPLLWQHLTLQPLGPFLKELPRGKSQVPGRFAIADIPLGRDAAALVRLKALRLSIGFQPYEFEPMEDDKGEQIGWRVRKFEIMETSLVSVPSNLSAEILSSVSKSKAFAQELDGIRTAYGRNLLKTDLVKQWAKRFHDNRPTQVTVPQIGEPHPLHEKQECTCGKSIGEAVIKVSLDTTELTQAIDDIKTATEKQSCTCPECGHRGPMSDFTGDYDEDGKAARIETLHFAHLIGNPRQLRAFRDRLDRVDQAHQLHREKADDSVDELLGFAASAP